MKKKMLDIWKIMFGKSCVEVLNLEVDKALNYLKEEKVIRIINIGDIIFFKTGGKVDRKTSKYILETTGLTQGIKYHYKLIFDADGEIVRRKGEFTLTK